MKLTVGDNNEIVLKDVYSGITLESNSGEFIGICMRDSGFEFNYNGQWYEAKNNTINKLYAKVQMHKPNLLTV